MYNGDHKFLTKTGATYYIAYAKCGYICFGYGCSMVYIKSIVYVYIIKYHTWQKVQHTFTVRKTYVKRTLENVR